MIWSGPGNWVWYLAQCGGIPGVIERSQAIGSSWTTLKGADGTRIWDQAKASELDELRAAGLSPSLWVYCYGEDWQREVETIIRMIDLKAPDGVIIDAEAEFRDHGENIEPFCQALRKELGDTYPLAYAPLPVKQYHSGLRFSTWHSYGFVAMPQAYENVLGPKFGNPATLAQTWASTEAEGSLLVPAYGTYAGTEAGTTVVHPTEDQVVRFLEAFRSVGAVGWSYYRLDTLDPDVIRRAEARVRAGEDEMTAKQKANVKTQLDAIWGLAESIIGFDHPATGLAIQAAVAAIVNELPPLEEAQPSVGRLVS